MSNQNIQNRDGNGFGVLSLLQQASSNRTKTPTTNDGENSGRQQGNMTFDPNRMSASNSSTKVPQQPPQQQTQQSQQQQQQQQQQQMGTQGFNDSRNDLVNMALNGDLAGALQYVNLGLQNNGGGMGTSNSYNNVGLGSSGALYQQLQQLGLQRLQSMHQNPSVTPPVNPSMERLGKPDTGQKRSSPSLGPVPSSANSVNTNSVAMTSASTDSQQKDDATKKQTVVVPCRARGMSMEHNFQTAYFEILDNIKHGDGLICSFPECRNRGVKFLFCSYCKDPVAKRNFRNRHSHAEIDQSKDVVDSNGEKKAPATRGPNGNQKPPLATIISSSSNQNSEGSGSSFSKLSDGDGENQSEKRPAGNMESPASQQAGSRKRAKIDPERKEAWNFLLTNRPATEHGDAMSEWLMHVMAISDPRKPISEVRAQIGDIYSKSGGNNATMEVTNESPPSLTSGRSARNERSTDSASSSSPSTDGSLNDEPNDLSPTDGSSNEDANDSSEDNPASSTDSSSDTQDPTNT